MRTIRSTVSSLVVAFVLTAETGFAGGGQD